MKGCKTTPDRVAFCVTRLPEAFPKFSQYCKSRTEENTNRLAHLSCLDRFYVRTQDLRTAKTGNLGGVHGTNDALVRGAMQSPSGKYVGTAQKPTEEQSASQSLSENCTLASAEPIYGERWLRYPAVGGKMKRKGMRECALRKHSG
jgi:hypothetical protein